MSGLPKYVEFGFRSSYPGPFQCREADMEMLVLEGNGELIEDLIRRTLTEPAGGAVEYRPLGSKVILVYGYNLVRSMTKPWDGYGAVAEMLASFWVPVVAGHTRAGRFHPERLGMTVPFLLVDNPMSHMAGREIYGFPKALGRFTPAGDRLRIEGYGGGLTPESIARWHDLLEIAPAEGAALQASEELGGTADVVDALGRELVDDVSAMGLGEDLCRSVRSGEVTQVFLKQFRDADDQTRACYQAVVEAPARMVTAKPSRPLREWEVKIHAMDSHPIVQELGLKPSQTSRWSVHLGGYEFDELPGRVVGPPVS